MPSVEFEEAGNEFVSSQRQDSEDRSSPLVKLAIRMGIAHNEHQANIIFIILTVICFAASLAINFVFLF